MAALKNGNAAERLLVDEGADGRGEARVAAEMLVRGQSEARRLIDEIAPSHVLSIMTPGRSYLGPRGFAPERQLFMTFDETDDPASANAPDVRMVEDMLAFARGVPKEGRLLIHGLLGVRRSSAVALGLFADGHPPAEAAQMLSRACSQPPDPQRLVVRLFDKVLGLDGALVEAAATRFVQGRNAIRRRAAEV
ncbi:hypothetical protein DYI37_17985 [Fulvimarina endophytica]|uniref:Tyrosine-protein phosphatase n=1 Tax=Fulvimarina endophytica TaxID=2293836 RepID=A0A371WYU6_9HYPH|nr:hypothetical protein [Fulvimarina endophytica]RFC62129.1 hypothetical protein DYI37_17985 [Fulvimarina endophytica]